MSALPLFVLGFRGYVRVVPFVSRHAPLEVVLNGIQATVSAAALTTTSQLRQDSKLAGACALESALPSPPATSSLYYTFSLCHTPVIDSLFSSTGAAGRRVLLNGMNLPPAASDVTPITMTVDGMACGNGSTSSNRTAPLTSLARYNESQVSTNSSLYCYLPHYSGGFYRLQLHVEGLGWAFVANNADQLQMNPSIHSSDDPPQGSTLGGTTVVLTGSSFGRLSSADTQVLIGNNPCDVTSVSLSQPGKDGSITCVTRAMVDDGYTAVVSLSRPIGYWRLGNPATNLGSTGKKANALIIGSTSLRPGLPVSLRAPVSQQARYFSNSRATVSYISELHSNTSFGIALWLKLEQQEDAYSHYRQIIGSYEPGEVSRGFSLWLSPCGNLELWIAPGLGETNLTTASKAQLCQPVDLQSSYSNPTNFTNVYSECTSRPTPCQGTRLITRNPLHSAAGGDISQLPIGVWAVYSHPVRNLSTWTYITFGYQKPGLPGSDPFCPDASNCQGSLAFSVDGSQPTQTAVNYLPPLASHLEFGGSVRTSLATPLLNRTTLPFAGQLAEVAMYDRPLTNSEIRQQFYYGNSDEQPILVTVGGIDRRGQGVTPEVRISLFRLFPSLDLNFCQ